MTTGRPPTGEPERREGNRQRTEIARLEREVEWSAKYRGQDHPETLRVKLALGAAQRAGGDLDASLACLSETFSAAQHLLDRGLQVEIGRELGLTLLAASRLVEAHALLERMLADTAELYGPQSAEWASAAEELALALRARGNLADALRLQRQALDVSRHALGDLDPGTLLIDMNLESATNLNRMVLPLLGTLQSPSLPDPGTSRGHLLSYVSLFDWERPDRKKFEVSLEDARRGLEKTSFHMTPYLVLFDSALAQTLARSHDPEELNEGYVLARRVWDGRKAALGAEHPQTLNSMLLLSRAAVPHDPEHAIEVGHEAAHASEAVLGRGHVDTLGAYEHLANMLDACGESIEAKQLRMENLRLRAADEGIFGDDQPPIENLAGTLTEPLGATMQGFLAERGPSSAPGTGGGGGTADKEIDPKEVAEALGVPVEPEEPGREEASDGEECGELVRRTAHVGLDPARAIEPGERFQVGVYVDCAAPDDDGSGELELRAKPGTTELTLRAWLVVTRHFEIEGEAIQPLELDLRESTSPRLSFAVRALRPTEYKESYTERPAVRVLFSYLGWSSGEVRLPVPLAQATSEVAV